MFVRRCARVDGGVVCVRTSVATGVHFRHLLNLKEIVPMGLPESKFVFCRIRVSSGHDCLFPGAATVLICPGSCQMGQPASLSLQKQHYFHFDRRTSLTGMPLWFKGRK